LSSSLKNLSDNELITNIPNAKAMRFGIVVSEWNHEVTLALKDGAYISYVPGSYELTLGAQFQLERSEVDAVICLGCVIQGETRHFDFICDAVAQGITNLNIKFNKPVIFGVLTPNTQQQAIDRAGGKHGNKGDEAAATAIKMLALKHKLSN
jgi:6,7-dimethyl-8-ribityllumazine synthase